MIAMMTKQQMMDLLLMMRIHIQTQIQMTRQDSLVLLRVRNAMPQHVLSTATQARHRQFCAHKKRRALRKSAKRWPRPKLTPKPRQRRAQQKPRHGSWHEHKNASVMKHGQRAR